MDNTNMSLRKMATILGVSQPFLSQIRAGKRPMPEALQNKVEALGAYHLLITDKHISESPGDEGAGQTERPPTQMTFPEANRSMAGVRGSRTHLPRSSRGITDLKSARATGPHPLPRFEAVLVRLLVPCRSRPSICLWAWRPPKCARLLHS